MEGNGVTIKSVLYSLLCDDLNKFKLALFDVINGLDKCKSFNRDLLDFVCEVHSTLIKLIEAHI